MDLNFICAPAETETFIFFKNVVMVIAQRRRPCACGVENIAKNTPSPAKQLRKLINQKKASQTLCLQSYKCAKNIALHSRRM
jgi:hypothetical protein